MADDVCKTLRGRTLARAQAMQLMFQAESTGVSLDSVLDASEYLVSEGPADAYAVQLALGATEHAKELDALVADASTNWDIARIGLSERLLMRLALYEALYETDIDDAIAISEAVKLSKLFGSDDAHTFVNGILGAVIRKERA